MDRTQQLIDFYSRGGENNRLGAGLGALEFVRTIELLEERMPSAPAVVLDVGGATGVYARWLLEHGYQVRMIDIVPSHVETARASGIDAAVGDARNLPEDDALFDVVALLGPLYHLHLRSDRLRAIREARRVARPGGLIAVAAIGRLAGLLDGFVREWIYDDGRWEPTAEMTTTGMIAKPPHEGFGAISYFHRSAELAEELTESGLRDVEVLCVEGPVGHVVADWSARWGDPSSRELILQAARLVERDEAAATMGPHMLAFGRV